MKTFGKKILAICVLGTMALFTYGVGAAEINTFDSEFSVKITPSNPTPGTPVTAEIVSYQFDVDRSVITWVLNSKEIARGIGEKKVSIKTPDYGLNNSLTINIITDEGISTSQTISLRGDDIDFLWESNTSSPVWYKGKALPSIKSTVAIVALPHLFSSGTEISPSSLIYDWSVNYKKYPKISGFGANKISIILNDRGESVVGLKVSNKDNSKNFQKVFRISSDDILPEVHIYENDPLKGIVFSSAVGRKIDLIDSNLNLFAETFNFIGDSNSLRYNWFINNKPVKTDTAPNTLSLRSGEESGMADILIKVENSEYGIFQKGDKKLRINF